MKGIEYNNRLQLVKAKLKKLLLLNPRLFNLSTHFYPVVKKTITS